MKKEKAKENPCFWSNLAATAVRNKLDAPRQYNFPLDKFSQYNLPCEGFTPRTHHAV